MRAVYKTDEVLLNFIVFQVFWWLCVLSSQLHLSIWVALIVCSYVFLHLRWIEGKYQITPIIITTMIGSIMDQLGYRFGWIDFHYHDAMSSFIPLWMFSLWMAFSCTLDVSLRWLQKKPLLAFVLGAVFGPLAYWGAMRLGVIELPYSTVSLAWVAIEWAVLMPLLLWIRVYFNRTIQS